MADLGSLIPAVIEAIGAIIQKPRMTEKLLSKPPFRFIHDTISAVTVATGFGNGLYSPEELDSALLTEKQQKLNYLDKICNLVGICSGRPLEMRSIKVIAGLEPENTNLFILALAQCSSNPAIDNDAAVQRCLSGETPGSGPPPLKQISKSESKNDSRDDFKPSESKGDEKSSTRSGRDRDSDSKGGAPNMSDLGGGAFDAPPDFTAGERGKSRGGTRGGKPNLATNGAAAAGLGDFGSMPSNLDSEIEKCDGTEEATKQILGSLISRPKLTDKLLQKPPFRFLYDIIMEVNRVTGFASNLFSTEESDPANIQEKGQKLAFLEKIIKVVGIQLNTIVEAKPNRIIAGQEPQCTNAFLQLLAVAARNLPDSSKAVRTTLEEMGLVSAADSAAGSRRPEQQQYPAEAQEKQPSSEREDRGRSKEVSASLQPDHREGASSAGRSREREAKEIRSDQDGGGAADTGDDKDASGGAGDNKPMRPTTARRRPPKVKDGAKELTAKDSAGAAAGKQRPEGILIDGQVDDDDEEIAVDGGRLADDMQADDKIGKGAGGVEPQSKLVKDILSRQAEQEAERVGKGKKGASEKEEASDSKAAAEGGAEGAGGIRIGRLRKTGQEKKGVLASQDNAPAVAAANTSLGVSDVERMRGSIQLLVQQTGPLGTCMDYIQEDVGLMTGELHKWEEECRRYDAELQAEKLKSESILKPLQLELSDLEDQINEQMAKISAIKATIAKDENRIQQTMRLISTA